MEQNITLPKWAAELPEGEKISTKPSVMGGRFLDCFDKYIMPCEETGDVEYYLFDPVKHGAEPDREYPLLVFFHGISNALEGRICISYCGAELYASPKYQEKMGGAYVLVPLANEKRTAGGVSSWTKEYFKPITDIINKTCSQHRVGKKIAIGGSMGGWVVWRYSEEYPVFAGMLPLSTPYISPKPKLDMFREKGIRIYYTIGQHDEYIDFRNIASKAPLLDQYDNITYCFHEWVRNTDGGVASLNSGGEEMGQHCMIIQVQANLMYNDGTPYDDRLPEGVTGWIKSVCEK